MTALKHVVTACIVVNILALIVNLIMIPIGSKPAAHGIIAILCGVMIAAGAWLRREIQEEPEA